MIDVIDQILIFSIFAMSLNLLLGYTGQVSVAHAAFGAIGGYAAGYLSIKGLGLAEGIVVGIALATVAGALIGLPALRLKTEYLILLTLAFQVLVGELVNNITAFGGQYGLPLSAGSLLGFDVTSPSGFLPVGIVCAVVVMAIMLRMGESPYGRVLRGIREDELASRSLGRNVVHYKITVFAITAGFAGLAGGLLAAYNQLAASGEFDFNQSMAIVAMVILGGTGNMLGSVVGTAGIIGTQQLLTDVVNLNPEDAGLVRLIIYGLILVAVMLIRPAGIVVDPARRLARGRFRRSRSAGAAPSAVVEVPQQTNGRVPLPRGRLMGVAEGETVLAVRGLTKSFGGVAAVRGVELELPKGRITGIVGPNGAGKTTIFSLLTGFVTPDSGSVELAGQELVGLRPEQVARLGLVRSFQSARVFPRLTALENVALGVQGNPGERLGPLFFRPAATARGERRVRDTAMEWLRFAGVEDAADELVAGLAFGDQKRIALARALATEAEVLLLDEPTAGIDPGGLEDMLKLVQAIGDHGRTVCIVEHNLEVISRLAADTYFLELGRVVARGPIQELMSNARLAEVYFGS